MKKNLHIIIYSELFEFGGGRETWLSYFLPEINRKEVYNNSFVYHITPRSNNKVLTNQIIHTQFIQTDVGKPEEHNPFRNALIFTMKTIKALKLRLKSSDDVILVGTAMEALPGLIIKYLWKEKINLYAWARSITVLEITDARSRFFGMLVKILERNLFRYARAIITNGKDTYDHYLGIKMRLNNSRAEVYLIENAVDHERYAMIPIPQFNKRKIRVAYLGRFVKTKGFECYLAAIKKFNEINQDGCINSIEFHAWGGHRLYSSEFPQNLVIHGQYTREDVPIILGYHDCLVFLNRSKGAAGLSHGLLEAMSAGRLIIAWNNPVHCQVLSQENAVLLQEEDVDALAQVFLSLAKASFNREDYLAKCAILKEKAQLYTVEEHIEKYCKIVC